MDKEMNESRGWNYDMSVHVDDEDEDEDALVGINAAATASQQDH